MKILNYIGGNVMSFTIKSSVYVVGVSLPTKAKQALMHAVEVGKEADDSELTIDNCDLCDRFLSETPYWQTVTVSKFIASFPDVYTAYALLMLIDDAYKSGVKHPQGVLSRCYMSRLLQYDALVVIEDKQLAEGVLKRSDEARRCLYHRLFIDAFSQCNCCDVLLNIGKWCYENK